MNNLGFFNFINGTIIDFICNKLYYMEENIKYRKYYMKRFKIITMSALILVLCITNTSASTVSYAYVLNGRGIENAKDAFYNVRYFPESRSTVISGILAWNSLPEIEFTKEVDLVGEINIEYVDSDYNDSYATSWDGGIAVYKP